MARRALPILLVLAVFGLPALAGGPDAPEEPKVWKPLAQLQQETGPWSGLSGPLVAADGGDLALLATGQERGSLLLVAYRETSPGVWEKAHEHSMVRDGASHASPVRWVGDGVLALEEGVALVSVVGSVPGSGIVDRVALRPQPSGSHLRSNETADGYGDGAAFDGSLFAVAAPGGEGAGGIVVLQRHEGGATWTPAGVLAEPAGWQAGGFGTALAMEGDWLAVADPEEPKGGFPGSGTVVMHRRDGSSFRLEQILVSPRPGAGNAFGTLLHMDGPSLAVMEPRHGAEEAVVHLYRLDAGSWVHEARLAVPRPEGAGTVILDLAGDRLIAGTSDGQRASEVRIWERSGGAWSLVQQAPVSLLAAAPHDLALLEDGWAAVSEPSPGKLALDIFGLVPVRLSECPGCLDPAAANVTAEPRPADLPPLPATPGLPELEAPPCPEAVAGLTGCLPLDLDLQPLVPVTLPLPNQVTLTYTTEVAAKLVGQALVAADPAALAQQVPPLPEAQLYIEVEAVADAQLPPGSEVTIEARAQAGSDPAELALHYWNGARWVDLSTVPPGAVVPGEAGGEPLLVHGTGHDPATGAVWAKVDHTSVYALGPRTAAPGLPWDLVAAVVGAMVAVVAFAGSAALALRRR
jgi:hypothetical protein